MQKQKQNKNQEMSAHAKQTIIKTQSTPTYTQNYRWTGILQLQKLKTITKLPFRKYYSSES